MKIFGGVSALALLGLVACSSVESRADEGDLASTSSALASENHLPLPQPGPLTQPAPFAAGATIPAVNLLPFDQTHAEEQVPPIPAFPQRVIRYPGAYPSFQAAVDAAPDGALIRIAPGTHAASAFIANKRLFIAGAGVNATRLVGASPQQNVPPAIFTMGAGADVVLHGVTLSTSGAAIVGASGNGPSPSLAAKDVAIQSASRAISGDFGAIVVHSLTASSTVDDAINVRGTSLAAFRRVTLNGSDNGKTVVIDNTTRRASLPCIVRVVDSVFKSGGKGGLAVLGGECPVYITRTRVEDASVFGIGLFEVPFARLLQVDILRTKGVKNPARPPAAPPEWGDGLFLWASDAQVDGARIDRSNRAGVSVFGCAESGRPSRLALTGSELTCNSFPINVESHDVVTGASCGSGSYFLDDSSGTSCSCAGLAFVCKAESGGLSAVPK